MLRFLKTIGIPVACLAALAGAVYLVFEADQRWERQRMERREMTGSGFASDTDRTEAFEGIDSSPPADASDAGEPASLEGAIEAIESVAATEPSPQAAEDLPVLDAWQNNGRTPTPLLQLDRPNGVKGSTSDGNGNGSTTEPMTAEQLQQRIRLATVRISHPELGPLGGGVIISRSRTGFEVLTAQHVIDGLDVIKITTFHPSEKPGADWDERNYKARGAVKSDALTDLAVIRVNSVLQPELHLDVAASSDDISEAAWALVGGVDGTPEAELVMLGGRQQARRHFDSPPVSYWRVMRPSEHGTSGSGLIDVYGKLIGIASGNSSGMAFYSDDTEIRKFLGGR